MSYENLMSPITIKNMTMQFVYVVGHRENKHLG